MMNALDFAIDTAAQAGEFLLEKFNLFGTHANTKLDRSVVTEFDLAADQLIANQIEQHFPEDGLVSEELQPRSPAHKRAVWVVDPLDGTTNYSLGLPFWGVSIARLVDGVPDTAAIYFPPVQEMYTAQRGAGAWLNEHPLHIKTPQKDQPAAFFSCCSRTYRRFEINVPYKPRILGSAAYNLCTIARSTALVGFEAVPKLWDLAGGWLLIEEAGGIVEIYDGPSPFPMEPDFDFRDRDFPLITAATRALADKTRTQIRRRVTS